MHPGPRIIDIAPFDGSDRREFIDGLIRPAKNGLSLPGVLRASVISFCAIMRRANP